MFTIAALYRFARIDDPAALRPALRALCEGEGLRGTLILAPEGINGTVAGPEAGIAALIRHVEGWPRFERLAWRRSEAAEMPFRRMKVHLKPEIVTMGRPDLDPAESGTRLAPAEWNRLIAEPDVVTIDTRNAYEVAIGSFDGAVDPETRTFREFPDWWRANRDRFAGKRVAMFCTGGIRCEKSTAFLREAGVDEVYHLDGGILRYLAEVPEAASRWRGGCFVFDGRVAVGHGLAPTGHVLCHACRRPLEEADLAHPDYEEGVACPHCAAETGAADKERYRERQRQVALARLRGRSHLAGEAG